jgi:hypothetical protein
MAKVLVSPLGNNRFSLVVVGTIWCDRMNTTVRNVSVLSGDDLVMRRLFNGKNPTEQKFIDCELVDLSYDPCDRVSTILP